MFVFFFIILFLLFCFVSDGQKPKIDEFSSIPKQFFFSVCARRLCPCCCFLSSLWTCVACVSVEADEVRKPQASVQLNRLVPRAVPPAVPVNRRPRSRASGKLKQTSSSSPPLGIDPLFFQSLRRRHCC